MSKKVLFGVIGVLGIFVLVLIIGALSLLGSRAEAVKLDELTKAQITTNQSNFDNMWKSFVEASQVTDKQATAFKEVYEDMITGRYEGDEDVLFKMVQEQNPQLNQDVYTQLQNLIIAGRKEFDNNQKKLADIIREYNTHIRNHFIMNAIFRFPELNSQDFIVTSDRTENAFESGKDDAIDLNGEK